MLTEVFKAPCSTNTAYLHFATAEGASVFFHRYYNKQLIINDVVFSVQAAKYPNRHKVKYAFKQINFTGSSAASASTNTNATAVSAAGPAAVSALSAAAAISVRAPAPAAAHSSDWVTNTKRALILIDDEIRDLKRRRKYLRKALKKSI
ncbi:hypothetical protein HMPREF1544_10048 [Mucor circinelloides 1006PhL]|uniref:Uncharacterized protein n=1 Tax=Mucor circinelloides f. circinelloides (strain 1006PhL) TaxID=1220926 RepID=S2JTU0_MUCC1|nr:hypothetical protein HMPREF1544_10048 [Mucor circinelloides 1006PhL]